MNENNVERQMLRRFRPLSSHPAHHTVSSTASGELGARSLPIGTVAAAVASFT
jgi:hypothetical protein